MSDSLTPSRPPAWPRQAPWLRQVLAFGLFLFGGGALGWLAGRALPDISDEAAPDLPLVIAVALLSVFGAIALHELGHVLGMLAANFRVLLYVVGPLKISREGDRLRLRLNRDLALAGGVAAGLPKDLRAADDDRALTRRYALVVAAGPAMSLALALLGGLGAAATAGTPNAFAPGIFALVNAAIFLVTAIPAKTSGFDTDGAQLLDLLRGGHRAERKRLATLITTFSVNGQRPRDWDPALMERWLALRDGRRDDVLPTFYGYYHALDRGEIERAGEFLDRALELREGMPGPFRPAVLLEAAYFTARYRQEAAGARALLDQARGGTVEAHSRLRAEAAVLWAEGRRDEAADQARAGLAAASKSWDKGGTTAEQDWLRALLADCQPQTAS